jgi:hypothetical protein
MGDPLTPPNSALETERSWLFPQPPAIRNGVLLRIDEHDESIVKACDICKHNAKVAAAKTVIRDRKSMVF